MEVFFKKLLASLEGELNLLVLKFYIRTCEKKKKFESEHKGLLEQQIGQISLHEVLFEWLEDIVDFYFEEDNSALPNLHKAVSSELTTSSFFSDVAVVKKGSFFSDVAEVTEKEGSDKGLGLLKQHLKQYIFMVPENYVITAIVEYCRQIIFHGKEVLKHKLDFIAIPELDLD